MGKIIRLADHDARTSSATLKAKTEAETSWPRSFRASRTSKNLSGAIPRLRQLTTAEAPTPVREAIAEGPPRASITSSTVLSIPPCTSQTVNSSSVHVLELAFRQPVTFHMGMADQLKLLANRLKVTREALEMSAAELCKAVGIKENRWSQYESGERKITLEVANLLCDEFGITLDWIYRGNPASLPHEFRLKLRRPAA